MEPSPYCGDLGCKIACFSENCCGGGQLRQSGRLPASRETFFHMEVLMARSGNTNSACTPKIANLGHLGIRSFIVGAKFCALRPVLILLIGFFAYCATLPAQTPITTWHYDNARTSANTTETVLTPSNVDSSSFGKVMLSRIRFTSRM
jgi:hypothetical protein